MSRIVVFEPRSSRDGRTATRQTSHYNSRYSLTRRLELLREKRPRAGALRASERYRAWAELYRLEAETFRDPKARAQMLQLAAICDREAEELEI